MKSAEIRDMEQKNLQDKLSEFRQELFNLRFQHSTAQLENTQRMKEVKKNIARIMTVLNERRVGA